MFPSLSPLRLSLLVLVVLLLIPEGAMAARWEKAEVPVWDFTPENWRPYVQATVDDFNANLPEGAPVLVYAPMGELPCEALPENGRKGGISVCAISAPTGASYATVISLRHRIYNANVQIDPVMTWDARHVLCHEFVHAITNVDDDYSYPHQDASCVLGGLDHLGSWDIAYTEKVYSHDSAPRDRAGGKHHRAKRGRA